METTAKRIHPLVAAASASVILVSLVGVAAMTGLLPSSHGTGSPAAAPAAPVAALTAPAPAAAPVDTSAAESAPGRPHGRVPAPNPWR